MITTQNLQQHYSTPQETYQKTPLYGGAITAELPTSFGDVRYIYPAYLPYHFSHHSEHGLTVTNSDIRQIPDNQEVYLHRTHLTSIVFDILERVQSPDHPCSTDHEALLYHYRDVTEEGHVRPGTESEEVSKIWESRKIVIPSLGPEVPAYTLLATQRPQAQPARNTEAGKSPVDFTGILFTMVRLERQKTDLLIAVNVPHARGEYDENDVDFGALKSGPLLAAAKRHEERILQTLKVEDWSLFVQE